MHDHAAPHLRATAARSASNFRLSAYALALLAALLCSTAVAQTQGAGESASSGRSKKPKVITEATTFTSPDGLVVSFTPSATGTLAKATVQAAATADDVQPCIFQHGFGTCIFGDGRMATTDWGMGIEFHLDGVTSSYRSEWKNSTTGASRIYSVYFDPQCPKGYYFDAGNIFAGDEYCWPAGQLQISWFYPHRAGDYFFQGSAEGTILRTDTAKVLPGTFEAISGSGQSTPVSTWAQAPLAVAIRDFRGNLVSYPVGDAARTSPMNFSISGPGGSTGAEVTPISTTPSGQSVAVRMLAGTKVGQYQVLMSSEDASPGSAVLTAVLRKEPDDNPEFEEGNGEDCAVADPITIGIGNSFQQATDYQRTGLSILEFTRSYNALGSKSKLMRNYWTTTFDRAVLQPLVAGGPIRVRRPDGRAIPFSVQNGVYQSLRPYFHGELKVNGTGWQYITEDNVTENYDSLGRWATITDPVGRTLTATYNAAGNLTKVTANTGEFLTFTYDSYNAMTSATDHIGRVWVYTYNGYGNLIEVKEPDSVYYTYHYESPHNPYWLTGISIGRTDPIHNSYRYVTWEFDSAGRVTANYFANSLRRFDIVYNDITGERIVTDTNGNKTIFATRTLNGRGFVDSVTGPGFASCGLADSVLERDVSMNVVKKTTFGRATRFGDFDEKGQYAFEIQAADTTAARRLDYLYDPRFTGKPTQIAEPSVAAGKVKVTQIDYDAAGNVIREVISGFRSDGTPVSRAVSLQYDGPYGQLSLIDGPRTDVSDITTFEYDAATKRLKRVIDPNGIPIRDNIVYTATGQISGEDRPNGLHVTYDYYVGTDLLKSVTETSATGSRSTKWTYNDQHLVASLTFSDGVNADISTSFQYDYAGQLTTVWSTNGQERITYTLDGSGNRTGESYSDSANQRKWLQRTFDAYGRVKDVINPGSAMHYSFHPDGTLTSTTDGRNNTTTYTYDDFKRLTRIAQPEQIETTLTYDTGDRLAGVTDGNLATTSYIYDDLGNRVRQSSPDTGVTTFTHDGAGNVIESMDAMGQVTLFTFDAGNRLTTVDREGVSDDEVYAYDTCPGGVRKLCRTSNGIGDFVEYEYDALGRVIKQTTNAGSLGYAYNAAGDVAELTYPSGRKVRYLYNGVRQVIDVTVIDGGNPYALARNIAHLPFGPATSWIYGNGLTEARQFDLQYRPTSFNAGGRSTVTYDMYDPNSNVAQRTVNGEVQSFTYDPLNRLESAVGAFGSKLYTYDAVGNRSSLTDGGGTATYSYEPQSNRLQSDSNWTYGRDANGNETRRQAANGSGWDLAYTESNRLLGVTQIESPETLLGGYRYNALGQRTIKATAYGDTRFVYGLSGELLAETQPDGSIVQEYVYLEGAPLALLGPPAAPAESFALDQFVDNPASNPNCNVKRSSNAFNGTYLNCVIKSSSFTIHWPWAPPYSGDYQIYARWAWDPGDQCYAFSGASISTLCIGRAAVPGTWVDLGRHHINAGVDSPYMTRGDNRFYPSISMDALRYVLVHKDLTDRAYKYVHTDALGTPLRLSDQSGNVVWAAGYDPFGTAIVDDDPDGNGVREVLNLRLPGQYYDAETGLHYNYFRDYDPRIGRYVESDPIGLSGGLSTYGYARNSPLKFIDPDGTTVACADNSCTITCRSIVECASDYLYVDDLVKARLAQQAIEDLRGRSQSSESDSNVIPFPGRKSTTDTKECPVESDGEKKRRNCQALKDSILSTCAGLTGQQKFRCFAAADTSFRQCMGWE